jgi:hypothetical protein
VIKLKIKIVQSIKTEQHGHLPEGLVGREFNVLRQDDEGVWIEDVTGDTLVLHGEYEIVQEELKHMSVMDSKKFIEWCNAMIDALDDRVVRGAGGGLVDDLAKMNQTRLIRDAAMRGEFNVRLLGDED